MAFVMCRRLPRRRRRCFIAIMFGGLRAAWKTASVLVSQRGLIAFEPHQVVPALASDELSDGDLAAHRVHGKVKRAAQIKQPDKLILIG